MYEDVREAMAQIYEGEPTFFGPPTITPLPAPDQVDKQEMADTQRRQKNEKVIKKGYTRVQEELKETRQNFTTAVTTGSRSRSEKIALEFFDQLKNIWGGGLQSPCRVV